MQFSERPDFAKTWGQDWAHTRVRHHEDGWSKKTSRMSRFLFFKNTWQKIKQGAKVFLDGSPNHFACELPEKPVGIPGFFLKKFFCRIELSTLHTQAIRSLPPDACVVYVNKFNNKFEFLFSNACFFERNLPGPVVAPGQKFLILQPGKRLLQLAGSFIYRTIFARSSRHDFKNQYFENCLLTGKPAFISLIETHDSYWSLRKKTDPLQALIELQSRTGRPVFIIPQLFFYTKRPDASGQKLKDLFLGPGQRPGILRKIIKTLGSPEEMFVELSEPLDLAAYIRKHESFSPYPFHLAMMLRRDLLNQITRHRQNTTGPVLKSYEEIKQNVLMDEELQTYMNRYAKRRNISSNSARKEAVNYFDEIAAKYRPFIMKLAVRVIQWMSTTLFEGISVDIKRLRNIKTMAMNGSVIYVPCHRSHIDALVMLATTYTNHLSPPHIFAGKNMAFWPMGPLLRMIGVFFVRRSFQGAVFYTRVFSAYIANLIEEGCHLNFFIEGTRSRSGKLLQPQLGMLTILTDVFQKNLERDMIFVPVYIGYDQVAEEKEYLHEILGGKKKPENAKQLLNFGKLFKRRFGKIYVKFTDPISLKGLLTQMDLPEGELTSKQKNQVSRYLGLRIMSQIDQATIVTPQALVASALLNSDRPIRSVENLLRQIDFYMAHLNYKQVELSESLIINPRNSFLHILSQDAQKNVIDTVQTSPRDWKDSDTFKVNKNRRTMIEYYKNNCIVHFIPTAFAAVTILYRDAFQFQSADLFPDNNFLTDLFQFEFTLDPDRSSDYHLRKAIKAFIDDAILSPHPTLPETYTITSPGYRKLIDFAAFLFPFIEAYWVTFKWLSQEPKKNIDPKARLKKITNFGEHLLKTRSINLVESLSVSKIENAILYFNKSGLRGVEDAEVIQFYEDRMGPLKKVLDR
ncbi:MAG: hypothetical protein FP816_12215 [Desulfobacteraceae bacterium]|nr:hypothetical protein [Desulfobacteraceae bacterium]